MAINDPLDWETVPNAPLKQTCRHCYGTGTVAVRHSLNFRREFRKCPECTGTGLVPYKGKQP